MKIELEEVFARIVDGYVGCTENLIKELNQTVF